MGFAHGSGMIPPTPGADPASRLFGWATPPDGAGPIGPDGAWPVAVTATREEILRGLNPLQHLPGVGMIYRATEGQGIPTTMRVLGAGIVGGPLGMLGAGFLGILGAMLTLPPDLSRPAAPAGMSATGSEQGVQPVSPGQLAEGAYTTLATVRPEWMEGTVQYAGEPGQGEMTRGAAAYQVAAMEYQRAQAVEKGLA